MSRTTERLADWWDHRTGYRALVHAALYENIPGGSRWRYVWGSTLVFTFTVQVITGLFLWMSYSPGAQSAWESVYFIQFQMFGGWLLRGLHHFTAQAMVVLLALHLLQVVIDSAYKAPREVNFWLGLILMQIVLGMSLTGYLLPWDQKGFWATRVATTLMGLVPVVGNQLQQLVVGGPDYGNMTLTRFFALHAGVLPILLVVFLTLHIYAFRRHGIRYVVPKKHRQDRTFWPDQILKDAVACLAVMAVILFFIMRGGLAAHHTGQPLGAYLGADLGAPADAAKEFNARPEWYFLFLFQFLKYFGAKTEAIGALVVPGVVMGLLFIMPWVGRWKLGHRFNVGLVICLLIGIGTLTGLAVRDDQYAKWYPEGAEWPAEIARLQAAGKQSEADALAAKLKKYNASRDHLDAMKEDEANARRARELVEQNKGIPPQGAVTLLRNDPQTQGPGLFSQHCSSCHTNLAPNELDTAAGKDALAKSTASNLYGFGSRSWIAGLLDPAKIDTAQYFGHAPILDPATGKPKLDPDTKKPVERDMVNFVRTDLTKWKPDEVRQVVAALSFEGHPTSATAAAIDLEAGRKLIADDNRCGQCHRFHNSVDLGTAPDLSGYGSREWLVGMISNPMHQRFYGKNNQRMPAFAADPDPGKCMLPQHTIEMIADWLREPVVADEKTE